MSDTSEPRYASQMKEEIETRDAIRQLLASRGWELLSEWLTAEVQIRREEYEKSGVYPDVMSDVYINGFRRAQLTMLRTIQDMPEKLIMHAESAIEQMKSVTGEEDA